METKVKLYRCGQCSRLDVDEGTIVTVVDRQFDFQAINMYPAPRNVMHIDVEREVRLCHDCMLEVAFDG